jgi:2-C-methyl-D-erythritol 4-phosphate cytidylyltransferase
LAGLKGKVLVIFGGGGGIGGAVATMAGDFGAKAYPIPRAGGVDVRDPSQVQGALAKIHGLEGRIDYVVNGAGVLRVGELHTRDDGDIRAEIETNYFGCIHIARAAHGYLAASGGSLLFFTSSSHTRGRASYAVYSSTKAAIVNLTQALADEWATDGIRVNAVSPRRTATAMRSANFGKEDRKALLDPSSVAETALRVLLQSYTGQVIDVNG